MKTNPRAKVVQLRPGGPRGLFCQPLNLHFPVVFHLKQVVTLKDARAMGVPGKFVKELVGTFEYYTLDADDRRYGGRIERTAIRCIADPAADSLVVTHHRSEDEASAHAMAVYQFGFEKVDVICRTADGIFTLMQRPTHPTWPGPLIIYFAHVPAAADNPFSQWEVWAMAAAPDGSVADFDDFVPDSPPIIFTRSK